MSESIKKPLPRPPVFLSFVHLVRVHHLYHPTSGDRLEDHIEEENGTQKYDTLAEVIGMDEFAQGFEGFIFFVEDIDVGECQLVENYHKQPQHPHK